MASLDSGLSLRKANSKVVQDLEQLRVIRFDLIESLDVRILVAELLAPLYSHLRDRIVSRFVVRAVPGVLGLGFAADRTTALAIAAAAAMR